MFKKNKNQQQSLEISQNEISTIIGEGFVLIGEVRGSSVIRIEGKIIGNVHVENGVILGEKGNIEGDLHTKSAMIYGTIKGNVKSSQLEIKKTGLINGDISTDTLEIELGAQYNGKLNMRRQGVVSETNSIPGKTEGASAQIPVEAKKAS
ncbi:MAG TPA: polymer-forming cytoskeletal protein [Hanamia sp.]|nr:polymer-forming cytoskeletal protein [Hanamia sp.]